jgi:nicotinate-nucleotide adenylyltransferase
MLCLATQEDENARVSKIEIERPEEPYSFETIPRLKEMYPDDRLFFVMGADSWVEITLWREWENVLGSIDHIVVTRPGFDIAFDHVGPEIAARVVDLRKGGSTGDEKYPNTIYITDSVYVPTSATDIRRMIKSGEHTWRAQVPKEVANYIEKYNIYS